MAPVKPLHALFIHGVGEQTSNFADEAIKTLSAACSRRGVVLYARSAHWAPLMDLNSTRFLKAAKARGSSANATQRLVANTLSDALSYRADRPVGEQILHLVDYEVSQLRADDFVIFAHSLGGLIACDWLRTRTSARLGKLVTFGCNIPLFTLGTAFEVPPAVEKYGKWLNYFYDSDMLGYPLDGVPELQHVIDMKLDDAGGLRWSEIVPGLAHIDYLGDRAFWKRVPKDLGL